MKMSAILFVLACFAGQIFAQATDSEVFLFNIKKENRKYVIGDGKNITNYPGYDNQPSFSLDSKSVLFTSIRNGDDSDIYEYSLTDRKTKPITDSRESEYTARELDKNTITFIREGLDQEMTVISRDRATGRETNAFKVKEPIAFYAFNSKGDALVWVRYAFWMRWVNTEKSVNRYVANYAQPSVPHLIPGTDKLSFMQRRPDDSLWIMEFDPATESVRPIVRAKDCKKDYCWMTDGSLLVGSGTKLFRFDEQIDKSWIEIADLESSGIKNITRMAASPDGKSLALVSNQ